MKKIIVVLLISCLLVTGCGSTQEKAEVEAITTSEVKEIIDNYDENSDVVIVDVRTRDEYHNKHLAGAINIPLDDIDTFPDTVDKNMKVIVYCQSGNRSSQAAEKLVEMGYLYVYDMGGINSWTYEFVEDVQ